MGRRRPDGGCGASWNEAHNAAGSHAQARDLAPKLDQAASSTLPFSTCHPIPLSVVENRPRARPREKTEYDDENEGEKFSSSMAPRGGTSGSRESHSVDCIKHSDAPLQECVEKRNAP